MKDYVKPEVTESVHDDRMAFPALGLALVGGYVLGKAATAIGKVMDGIISSQGVRIPESVIA